MASSTEDDGQYRYRIKTIRNIPVKFLAPRDVAVFSVLFYALCLLIIAFFSLDPFDFNYLTEFIQDNALSLIISVLALSAAMTWFYSAKSVRVVFEDVRDVDQVLAFLTSQIGYRPPTRTPQALVFKPSRYDFLMFSARKISAQVDGFSVILAGNYMFINKLIKMLKIFQDEH